MPNNSPTEKCRLYDGVLCKETCHGVKKLTQDFELHSTLMNREAARKFAKRCVTAGCTRETELNQVADKFPE